MSEQPQAPSDPPDEGPGDDRPSQQDLPPPRKFVVRRFSQTDREIEEITIFAHEASTNPAGNVLRFMLFFIDEKLGPSNLTVRCFNGWIDFEELYEPPLLIELPTTGAVN